MKPRCLLIISLCLFSSGQLYGDGEELNAIDEKSNITPFNPNDLMSIRSQVPSVVDLASGVGSVTKAFNNYGNPADLGLASSHPVLNLSLSQTHWPVLGFLRDRQYYFQAPLKVGLGIPIKDSSISATLLMDFYRYVASPVNYRLNRGFLGGDVHASYHGMLGISGHWWTTNTSLVSVTKPWAPDETEESLFGISLGGKLDGRIRGWAARFDTHHDQGEFRSSRLELSLILPPATSPNGILHSHSLSYVYTERRSKFRKPKRFMWSHGVALRISRQYATLKPLWLWWHGKLGLAVGRVYPVRHDSEEDIHGDCGPFWKGLGVMEIEGRIGGEYQFKSHPLALTAQVGFIRSSDSFVWNEGIFYPAGWGHLGISLGIIHGKVSGGQLAYIIGYERLLPNTYNIYKESYFVKFGFHQRLEWRYMF